MTTTTSTVPIVLHAPRLHGVAILAAPVLLLISSVAFLTSGDGINDGVLGGTISAWSCFAFVLGFVGIARSFEAVAPRASVALLVLSVLGFMTGMSYSISAIDLGFTGKAFMGGDPEGGDAIGLLAFDPWGLCLPLACVLLAVLVWRTGLFPRWAAVPILLGGLLFVPSREVDLGQLAVVADVLLTVGLAPIGLAILASRSVRRS